MIYIRTDMNDQIATGHIMRCLSIADALHQIGESVKFIVADKNAVALIEKRGYTSIILGTDWNNKEEELPLLKDVIYKFNVSKLLIDSYQVTQNYLLQLSSYVKIMYIDDLNMFEYPVDTIVCYANYWSKFHYEENKSSRKFLVGTEYVPLRKAFWNCKEKAIKKDVDTLLLLSGGTDTYNFLGNMLQRVNLKNLKKIDVICGRYNENYENLCARYKEHLNVVIHKDVSDIEKYMEEADLAISAGGTTLYELCAIGTPTISYSFVDNQLDNVRQFEQDKLINYAGDLRMDDVVDNVVNLIEKYQMDYELRRKCSKRMQNLVDGKGSERLAQALVNM